MAAALVLFEPGDKLAYLIDASRDSAAVPHREVARVDQTRVRTNLQNGNPPVSHSISLAENSRPMNELAIVESAPEKKKQEVGPTSFLLKTKADL